MMTSSLLFGLLGWLVGGIVNVLADDLPAKVRPSRPHCRRCGHIYGIGGWLAVGRRLRGGKCPQCALSDRPRDLWVELTLAVLLAALPWFIEPTLDRVIYSIYVAALVLVIVTDLEHRLILHAVTFPVTVFALLTSFFLSDSSIGLALTGAAVGFVLFFVAFVVGQRLFGPGALGFGDVTLATMMGAMLGLQRIIFALVLGILLAGIWSLFGLLSGRMNRGSYFAYGPYLAVAGILMIILGTPVVAWYLGQ